MREDELGGLLHRAVEDVPEQDLAEQSWARGRRERRRRRGAGVLGGLVAAGLLGLAVAQAPLQGGPLHPSGTTAVAPAGEGSGGRSGTTEDGAGQDGMWVEPPPWSLPLEDPAADGRSKLLVTPPFDAQGTREQAHRVWATLWTACLESRGYSVDVDGHALTMTREGAAPGDYLRVRSSCRAEVRTDSPAVLPPDGRITRSDRTALMTRWFEYDWAQQCLVENGLPTGPRPRLADTFVNDLVWAQLPTWHPYTAAAEAGLFEDARDHCPIARP